MKTWGQFWACTTLSARMLFEEVFPAENLAIRADGNVLAGVAFLHGLAAEEFTTEQLDHNDPYYEGLISARAQRPPAST